MPCNDHNTLAIGYKDGRIKLHDVYGENTELVIEAGTSGSVSSILMYQHKQKDSQTLIPCQNQVLCWITQKKNNMMEHLFTINVSLFWVVPKNRKRGKNVYTEDAQFQQMVYAAKYAGGNIFGEQRERSNKFSMTISKEGKLAYNQSTKAVSLIDLAEVSELGYFKAPLLFRTEFEPASILINPQGHLFALGTNMIQKWPQDPRDNMPSEKIITNYQILETLWIDERNFIAACVPGLYIFSVGDLSLPEKIRPEDYYCLSASPCDRFIVAGGRPFLVVVCRATRTELLIIEHQRAWDIQASSTMVFFSFHDTSSKKVETRTINLMETKKTAKLRTETIKSVNLSLSNELFIPNRRTASITTHNNTIEVYKVEYKVDGTTWAVNQKVKDYASDVTKDTAEWYIQLIDLVDSKEGWRIVHAQMVGDYLVWAQVKQREMKLFRRDIYSGDKITRFIELGQLAGTFFTIVLKDCNAVRIQKRVMLDEDFDNEDERGFYVDFTKDDYQKATEEHLIEIPGAHDRDGLLQKALQEKWGPEHGSDRTEAIFSKKRTSVVYKFRNKMYTAKYDEKRRTFSNWNFLNNILWDGQAERLIWINEEYFMVMSTPNVRTSYNVIRLEGSVVLTVSTTEIEILRNSTTEKGDFWAVAFLDIKSGCFYHASLENIFHLCGSGAQFFNEDKFGMLPNPKKIDKVYGLPAPATYLYNLKKFQIMTADKRHMEVLRQSLKYTLVLESSEPKEIKQENLLQYLVRQDDGQSCALWLSPVTSNYFHHSNKVLQNVRMQCAPAVLNFLEGKKNLEKYGIFNKMIFEEIVNIFENLPDETVKTFVDLISVVSPDVYPDIRSESMPKHPITGINHFFGLERDQELQNKTEKQLMKKAFWEGNIKPLSFEKNIIKFYYPEGTWRSIMLLKALVGLGNSSEVFTSKAIKKLLDHKYHKNKCLLYLMLTFHLCYLFSLFYISTYLNVMIFWLVIQGSKVTIRVVMDQWAEEHWLNRVSNRFHGWDLFDTVRILFQVAWIVSVKNDAPVQLKSCIYSILVFVSWLGVFQYLRMVSKVRDILQQLKESVNESIWYIFALLIFISMQSLAYIAKRQIEEQPHPDTQENDFGVLNGSMKYFNEFIKQFMMTFGDFQMDSIRTYDYMAWFLSCFTVIFTYMIMMNLLIGIISEAVGKQFDNKIRGRFWELCDANLVAESYMFWNYWFQKEEIDAQFLVFFETAMDEDEAELEAGRVMRIANRAEKIIKSQMNMTTGQSKMTKNVDSLINSLDIIDTKFLRLVNDKHNNLRECITDKVGLAEDKIDIDNLKSIKDKREMYENSKDGIHNPSQLRIEQGFNEMQERKEKRENAGFEVTGEELTDALLDSRMAVKLNDFKVDMMIGMNEKIRESNKKFSNSMKRIQHNFEKELFENRNASQY